MLAMVSGSVGLRPQPGRRPDLHLRALAAAGADDRQEHRPLGSPPANATLFAIAAVLLFSAAFFSLAGWVARRSMRKYGRRPDGAPPSPRRRPACRPPAGAPQTPAQGRRRGQRHLALSDRIGLAICWALGLLFCAIAVAIVVYLLRPGDHVPEALDAGHSRPPAGFSQSETRRLLRRPLRHPDRRHDGDRDRAAGRRRRSRSGWSSTAARRRWRGSPNRRSRRSPASPRSCSPCSAR